MKVFEYSISAVSANGHIYFVRETKEGISTEEFPEPIDGTTGHGLILNALVKR